MPGDITTKMSIDYRESDTNLARRHFLVHRKKKSINEDLQQLSYKRLKVFSLTTIKTALLGHSRLT